MQVLKNYSIPDIDVFFSVFSYQVPFGFSVDRQISCRTSFQSQVIESSKQLRDALSTSVSASGGAFGVEFSASVGYSRETESIENSHSTKVETTASCKYYEVELEPFRKPGFHYTFQQSVQRMKSDLANGGELSDAKLLEFFQLFGTHYVTSAMYGSRYTNMFTLTSSEKSKMEREGVDIEVAASYSGAVYSGSISASVATEKEQNWRKFSENSRRDTYSVGSLPPGDGDANTWASEVHDNPSPVSYTLAPISEVFDGNRFPKILDLLTNQQAQKIKHAIETRKMIYCNSLRQINSKVYCDESDIPVSATSKPTTRRPTYVNIQWPGQG